MTLVILGRIVSVRRRVGVVRSWKEVVVRIVIFSFVRGWGIACAGSVFVIRATCLIRRFSGSFASAITLIANVTTVKFVGARVSARG